MRLLRNIRKRIKGKKLKEVKMAQVYNKIYTPEKWEKVNPENKHIIDDFILEYKARKKSEGTIK